MFLFSQLSEVSQPEKYDFVPHIYGPYSRELRRDLDTLVEEGAVRESDVDGYSWKAYSLTESGVERARGVLSSSNENDVASLLAIKERVCQASFSSLLKDVYEEYPDFAVNSIFRR
jgi:uncharacterized protein YwgA